jgi:hypothetical protein
MQITLGNHSPFSKIFREDPLQVHVVSVQPRRRKIQMSEVSIPTAALKKSKFLFGMEASNAQGE